MGVYYLLLRKNEIPFSHEFHASAPSCHLLKNDKIWFILKIHSKCWNDIYGFNKKLKLPIMAIEPVGNKEIDNDLFLPSI